MPGAQRRVLGQMEQLERDADQVLRDRALQAGLADIQVSQVGEVAELGRDLPRQEGDVSEFQPSETLKVAEFSRNRFVKAGAAQVQPLELLQLAERRWYRAS